VPRRRTGEVETEATEVKQEADPEVERMFDILWEAFLDVAEDVVEYDTKTRVWEEMSQELGDAITRVLMYDEDAGLCDELATTYFANYIVSGRPPSVRELKADIEEDIASCLEEELDELVKCINTYYRCYKLLVRFLRSLPNLLNVTVIKGDLARNSP
jgi:NTP pyrophosphatase (non-canonical NTP hydrolase)